MTGLEIWLLAVGLAMDCFAVSIASGIILKRVRLRPMLGDGRQLRLFPGFDASAGMDRCQFFQPPDRKYRPLDCIRYPCLPGWTYDNGILQGRGCKHEYDPTSLKVVLALAVATSIDALAVGVSFAFLGIKQFSAILSPIGIIGFVSFALSMVGLMFGIRFGCGIARRLRAELWGGVILVIIGTKILIEHLFF